MTRHADATAAALRETLVRHLDELRKLKPERLIRKRREKFMRMGQFIE
jgi:acetyl-CoA carboxylase carboxyl transferase subunit alpha